MKLQHIQQPYFTPFPFERVNRKTFPFALSHFGTVSSVQMLLYFYGKNQTSGDCAQLVVFQSWAFFLPSPLTVIICTLFSINKLHSLCLSLLELSVGKLYTERWSHVLTLVIFPECFPSLSSDSSWRLRRGWGGIERFSNHFAPCFLLLASHYRSCHEKKEERKSGNVQTVVSLS